jgi:hypothetical protein
MRRCRGCTASLEGRRPNAVWCSETCRIARWRETKAVQNPFGDPGQLPGTPRLKPSARRVLTALRNAGPRGLTTAQLCQPGVGGVRFSARIMELRDVGLTITSKQERSGSYRYKLTGAAREEAAA